MTGSGPVIYRRVNRIGREVVRRAAGLPMADMLEAMGAVASRERLMTPRMRPIAPGLRAVGCAVTASCAPGDNLMMHQALYLAEPGDVLVVKACGEGCGAQWGGTAAAYARKKGLAGIVVDGGVRDTDALRNIGSAVWATAVSPSHPEKAGAGTVNAPVVCGGVLVRPGDLVAADGDGVLVVPRQDAAAVVEAALLRAEREARMVEAFERGAHPFEEMGLAEVVERLGIAVHDRAWDDP
jgi:4-hydroxy-4-methyl-2-oxoglutarate aldolase